MPEKDLNPTLRNQIEEVLIDSKVGQAEKPYIRRIDRQGGYKFIFPSCYPRFHAGIPSHLERVFPGMKVADTLEADVVNGQFIPARVRYSSLPILLTSRDYHLVSEGRNNLMTYVNKNGIGSFTIKDVGRLPIVNSGSDVDDESDTDGFLSISWKIVKNGSMLGIINYSGLQPGRPIEAVKGYLNNLFFFEAHSASLFRTS
jgi:hypothetical protein